MNLRSSILLVLVILSFHGVNAKKKRILDLSRQSISDVTSLSIPEEIRNLNLRHNNISDLNGLVLPSKLKKLFLGSNNISNLEGLNGVNQLYLLDVEDNIEADISEIQKLEQLKILYISFNQYDNNNLDFNNLPQSIEVLSLAANLLETINLETLTSLKELNVKSMFSTSFGGDGRQIDYSKYTLPTNLEKLLIGNTSRADDFTTLTLPENLKKLSLFAAFLADAELQTLTLPPSLKILDLRKNNLTTLDGIDIPDSIRKINLKQNNFSKEEKRKTHKRFGKKVKIKF